MRTIERRLSKLETSQAGDGGVIVITIPAGMSADEAKRRHFGDKERPPNALIVLIQKFSCEDGE
jgi:hypothetical protein